LVFAAAALNLVADTADRVANDPPREEFNRETRLPRPRTWPPELLSGIDDEPSSYIALATAKHATDASSLLKAHLAAFELPRRVRVRI
jgi:hypothetical protein